MPQRQGPGKIDWTEYTSNPYDSRCGFQVEGNGCEYCWAEAIRQRFHSPAEHRMRPKELAWDPHRPALVAYCLMTDLFHSHVPKIYTNAVLQSLRRKPHIIGQFLTKAPWNLHRFSFPSNAWVGTTVDGSLKTIGNFFCLASSKCNAQLKFLSIEPLLAMPKKLMESGLGFAWKQYKWMIIGADSRKGAKQPDIGWANALIRKAIDFDIAVFVKDNFHTFPVRFKEFPILRHGVYVTLDNLCAEDVARVSACPDYYTRHKKGAYDNVLC